MPAASKRWDGDGSLLIRRTGQRPESEPQELRGCVGRKLIHLYAENSMLQCYQFWPSGNSVCRAGQKRVGLKVWKDVLGVGGHFN